ncbi:MAG: pur operon repressor, partial [Clostridia bacterium]|nr:pur operon repressor [Clostridia bacterium]
MDKIRRNERMSAMMKILSDSPNRLFTLSYFCELFSTAKSTMSEDIDLLREVVQNFGLGEIRTITGAAGGVMYRAKTQADDALEYISSLCKQLSGTDRILPG